MTLSGADPAGTRQPRRSCNICRYVEKSPLAGAIPAELGSLAQLQVAESLGGQYSYRGDPAGTRQPHAVANVCGCWAMTLTGAIPAELGNLSQLKEYVAGGQCSYRSDSAGTRQPRAVANV